MLGPVRESPEELRVDVAWRLPINVDGLWELDRRELSHPAFSPGGDLAIGSGNGRVYRIASYSGEVLWSAPVGGSVDTALSFGDRMVFAGTQEGEVIAFDWSDGQEVWRFSAQGSIDGRVTYANGRVFFIDSNEILYAVNATTGERIWDLSNGMPEFFSIKGAGEPLVRGDVIYAGFADGMLRALDESTGDEIWSVYLGGESGEFGDIDAPLVYENGHLYAVSHAGGIHCIEASTGAMLWKLDRENVVGLANEGGFLFGASGTGRVFAIRAGDGQVLWEERLAEARVPLGISFAGPFLAVSLARGPMIWMDVRSGEAVLEWAPSSGFQNAPIFDASHGYVMSNLGYLYGFQLAF